MNILKFDNSISGEATIPKHIYDAMVKGTSLHSRIEDDWLDAMTYCYNDIKTTQDCFEFFKVKPMSDLSIKKVIFNNPATIVYWSNGERTIVKCSEDNEFDQEKGLAMAICKRALGANYKKVFKEWIPEEEKEEVKPISAKECVEAIRQMLNTSMSFAFGIDKADKESETTIEIKQPEGLAFRPSDEIKLTVED